MAAEDDLIVLAPEGLYCPAGDFHIDPWRPVPRAVITHAHADHARRGHGAYLATAVSAGTSSTPPIEVAPMASPASSTRAPVSSRAGVTQGAP